MGDHFFGNGRRLGSPRLITLIVGMALLLFHCSPVNAEPPQARPENVGDAIGTIAAASVTGFGRAFRSRVVIGCGSCSAATHHLLSPRRRVDYRMRLLPHLLLPHQARRCLHN